MLVAGLHERRKLTFKIENMDQEKFDRIIESWKKEEVLWQEELADKAQKIQELTDALTEIHEMATCDEFKYDNIEGIALKCEEILYPKPDPAQIEADIKRE